MIFATAAIDRRTSGGKLRPPASSAMRRAVPRRRASARRSPGCARPSPAASRGGRRDAGEQLDVVVGSSDRFGLAKQFDPPWVGPLVECFAGGDEQVGALGFVDRVAQLDRLEGALEVQRSFLEGEVVDRGVPRSP